MNTITGILLFKQPNIFSKPCPSCPSLHSIAINFSCNSNEVTQDESYAVGTCCGAVQFHQDRVNEYIAFKSGKKSMRDILFQYDTMLTLSEYNSNPRFYHNRQMRRWFGKDLIDVY